MEVYLSVVGYDVWQPIIYGDISTDETRRYNEKTMDAILRALPDFVKGEVD